MESIFEKYQKLTIDSSWIGLSYGDDESYFCTPLNMKIKGWDNGIHYGTIDSFQEMIFCVNPEPFDEHYVYPIAYNFEDFLRLILATGNTNILSQIICWDKKQYKAFITSKDEVENKNRKEVQEVLTTIKNELKLEPMSDPFEYVKQIQKDFSYDQIQFSSLYYECLGIEENK